MSTVTAEPAETTPRAGRLLTLLRSNTVWTLAVLVALFVFFAVLRPAQFASTFNIRNVLTDSAILLVLSVGMTFVIVTAGIDLSVGSVLVFSGVVAAKTMVAAGGTTAGWGGIALGALAGAGSGLGWGLVNGLLVAKAKIPPLIATLGTLGVSLGLAQVITNGGDVNQIPSRLANAIGYGLVAGVPWLVVIAVAIAVVFGLLLALTRFGRHTYAIGSNAEAARRVGIKVDRHLVKVYALSGLLSGVAGVLSLAHYTTTTIASHTSDNLGAIAAVVIGGASLFGGVGTVAGTVIGVLIPGVLRNGLIILGARVRPGGGADLSGNGSKVIFVDTELADPSVGLSRISSDNRLGGRLAAQTLAKQIGDKGKVMVLAPTRGIATTDDRVAGFKEELTRHPGITLVSEQYPGDDAGKATELVNGELSKDPDLAGIFASNLVTGEGSAASLKQAGKVGKVKLIEFDASPKQVEDLKAGTIQALISQEPLDIGRQGVDQAMNALQGRPVTKRIQTRLVAVTKDDVDSPDIAQYLYKQSC